MIGRRESEGRENDSRRESEGIEIDRQQEQEEKAKKRWRCIIGGSCYKYHFCRDKLCSFFFSESFVATKVLSRQNYACRDNNKNRHIFFSFSSQAYFCRDKRCVLSRPTRVSSRQCFCRDKNDTCGSSRQ